jgi:tRNA(Ile2)-agmatinylcytidine synthase
VDAIWVGIDDTDAPTGGCTTWVLTELLRLAREDGVDLLGEPRLVRLNPNIPWKTRGNAALAARFGHGRGPRRIVGEVAGRPVFAYDRGGPLDAAPRRAFVDRLWKRVRSVAADAPGTDPALVAADERLPASFYWEAVREVVPVGATVRRLDRLGVFHRTVGGQRGLVGAAAAIAWPGRRSTWEMIAYRAPARWGTTRAVDAASVRRAQRAEPSLFLCHDPRTRRLLVAPHTPCPILFGLRATDAKAPLRARRLVRSEPVDRWMLFRTNQGTGDHLVERRPAELRTFRSGIVEGTVVDPPLAGPGGHVRFAIRSPSPTDTDATLACLAFEPTKTLPRVALSLVPGDRVRVWGSRGRAPGLRLEGLSLVRLVPRPRAAKPVCPDCRRPARSLGTHRGYRCPACRRRWPPEAAHRGVRDPTFPAGEYHPTPSARRHLAPLAGEP